MPEYSYPGVYVEEIDSGVQPIPGVPTGVSKAMIEEWCLKELKWVICEPNASPSWDRVVQQLRGYLTPLWVAGALKGRMPEEAFFVKCDQTTMTPVDIHEGRLICLVGVALAKPAEFVIFRIQMHLNTP